jgi:hypothetical protein
MHEDLSAVVDDAEAILLLPGWARSVGAFREFQVADSLGLPCYVREDDKLIQINQS